MIARDSPPATKKSVQRSWPWPAADDRTPVALPLELAALRPVVRIAHRRPGQGIGRRIIADHELVLVVAGRSEALIGGAWHRAGPGDVLIIKPFTDHRIIDLGDAGSEHIAVHFDWAPGLPPPARRRPYRIDAHGWALPPAFLPRATALGAAVRAAAAVFRPDDAWAEWQASLRLAAGLLPVLLRAADAHPAGDARLAALIARLSDDLAFPWDAAAVAHAAGLSPSRCRAWFRTATGLAPLDWLRRARVDRARELLTETQLPVGAIAAQVGFADQLHFSRVFHRLAGRSPLRERQSSRP